MQPERSTNNTKSTNTGGTIARLGRYGLKKVAEPPNRELNKREASAGQGPIAGE